MGYLASGVFCYGLVGWALDRWLGTSYLVVVGILAGAGLGLYLTWNRFKPPAEPSQERQS
jgi:F0F1-type ATP synthase assembly protein I